MKKITQNKVSDNNTVAIGLGVGALAAAAAGAYFLHGSSKGPARRKALKSWSLKMKGDVMEQLENMKDLTEVEYYKVIDTVAEKYQTLKNIDPEELSKTIKVLKTHWKDIKKEVKI